MTLPPDRELEAEPGYVPPDPDEPPPTDLWSAVGGIRPWSTLLLLLAWGAVFAVLAYRRELADPHALLAWGASATRLEARETAWRLLASTFVHAGAAHVVFNAAGLLVVGPAVERIFTRSGFWTIYAAGGALASLASVASRAARHGAGLSISVGASGAIFALGGALVASAWRLRHRLPPGRARALGGSVILLVGQWLAAGLTRHATDNVAHTAGLAAGALLGALVPLSARLGGPAPHPLLRALGLAAALALAISLALAVRGGIGAR
jgi:rhomboid protease GluP